jgi:hypothetical protein
MPLTLIQALENYLRANANVLKTLADNTYINGVSNREYKTLVDSQQKLLEVLEAAKTAPAPTPPVLPTT